MGSNVSCNDIDSSSNSIKTNSNSMSLISDNVPINNSNINKEKLNCESTQSHVYIKDKFQLEFLDCDCCCDTTKKVVNYDFQGINVLQDLYEMIVSPEYKLNCRCSCGDDIGDTKQSIKFSLTGSPNIQLTCDDPDRFNPTYSDAKIKQ
ncbi:unnamed protein product [Rotaria sp. Silwood1]|nr:unnamed protein product [Rotaria sp. Silwood1]CAF1558942.1 unnamed protein product [Rotaria sp. Silwood1]CAF3687665.1 unnamed protein product [Rotaria sp. Silwood1]CAF4751210.1 unnamed protein product [Rotaria sp. Silwood1]CAF4897157.1 unnamed protein product [Rotaria sp. Silwood1]